MVISSEEEVTSSSSAATLRWKHDVFLSFRGEDTRTNFTDHLYTALKQKGINTFRDDERLERGKPISPELLKAIEESRFAVIVFSRNYANSTWCLDELAKIIECMIERGLIVYPVFYNVSPSEVRKQTGTFAEAFANHEERFKENIEMVQTWRAALKEVANLSGWELGERHESELIRQIVEKIFLKLHDKIQRAEKGLVGIYNQMEELNGLLCIGSNDVRVIGIWGMGGIGKTTLAKVVCDIYSSDFEGCCFIKNIKDFSKESDFVQLQQQLLYEILNEENIRIWNVESGVNVIKKRLRSKKILLVLDDVNHSKQLKYFVKERDWFGFGSRIIITTRDKHLLDEYRVNGIHECKKLNIDDSIELFSLKAFKEKKPKEGYEKISRKVVYYANQLPLALDVLGSFLAAREKKEWEDALKRLKEYPNQDIIKNLEISYDGLDKTEQEIFIYIACFLKGRNKGLVIDILKSLRLHPIIGMNVLIEKALITISNNIVSMHDLLQEMGWEILYKQSPRELGNRIGLKLRKDILDVLTNNEGTKSIEIINQELSMEEVKEVANCTCNPEVFSKMSKLRFLRIQNVYFLQGIEYLSNELRILEWHGYPLKSLPSSFQPKEIFELDMRDSEIEKLWEGAMLFPNLRSIDLSCSENLTRIPDLGGTPSLETLDLHGCTNLVEGHSSILVHKRLNYLNMADCTSLENLPSKIKMESLKTLILSNCSKVRRIPEFGENMKCLEELCLDGTAIEEIPASIRHLTGLVYLNFARRPNLGVSKTAITEMHYSIAPMNLLRSLEHFSCLKELDLSWCHLSEIPNTIGYLSFLNSLELNGNNFATLPTSISRLSKLDTLSVTNCKRLRSLSDLPSSILRLTVDGCTSLEKISNISEVGNWDNITSIFTCTNCPKLVGENICVSEVILKCHLQGSYGQKVPFFTMTYGGYLSPWFTHQSFESCASVLIKKRKKRKKESYVSVELPPNWCDNTWLGFALCAVFSCDNMRREINELIVSVFATKSMSDDLQCICPPKVLLLNSLVSAQSIWYVPKDTKAFELLKHIDWNQYSGKIVFKLKVKSNVFYRMNCGVRLVYKEDVEEFDTENIPG